MNNAEYVKDIAKTLNDIGVGPVLKCPCCGDRFNPPYQIEPDKDDDLYYCPDCDETLESLDIYDYFDDTTVYNIEYRVSSKHEPLKSVSVCIAWGGPEIWIDTADCKVKLYWWGDYAECEFNRDVANEITDYFNTIWECE